MFGTSSNDPVFGKTPEIGDEVYIDFGDSVDTPEMRGIVQDMSDDGVQVNDRWHTWSGMAHVEVLPII